MQSLELIVRDAFEKDRRATEALIDCLADARRELVELKARAARDIEAARRREILLQEFVRLMPEELNRVTGKPIFPGAKPPAMSLPAALTSIVAGAFAWFARRRERVRGT